MEIRVKGVGEKSFVPDQIVLELSFRKEGQEYAGVLEEGVRGVKEFADGILAKNGFALEDMKTNSFVVRENRVYNEATRVWEKKGFVFTQDAHLEFDYDRDRMATLMDEIAHLENAPTYNIVFSLKDKKAARRSLLAAAYQDAELQARAIAEAAGERLGRCLRTDFQSNMPSFNSASEFRARKAGNLEAEYSVGAAADDITATFVPEDVVVSETLYCLWGTE